MTRSIRGVLLATSAVLAAGLLTGCGAGRETQTSIEVPAIAGVNADVVVDGSGGAGRIAIRNAAIAFGDPQGYAQGGTAPLVMNVINETGTMVSLTTVTLTEGGGSVVLAGTWTNSPALSGKVTPGVTPAGTVTPSVAPAGTGTARAGTPTAPVAASGSAPKTTDQPTTGQPTTSASPSGTPAAGALDLAIPADSYIALTPAAGRYLTVAGLPQALRLDDTLTLTFTFTLSGGRTATKSIVLPFDVPTTPLPRSPIELPSEVTAE